MTICEEDGTIGNLADKGMGGIQLMILLMRLAIIIRTDIKNKMSTIVLLEEPEQNLHPAFQSKLSMLFYEINKKYGIRFIVETHSEYMIRSSQVIVAKKQFCDDEVLRKENPFKVYYFPTIEEPYQMQYRRDGNFSNEFGKGFFDEANNLLFEIL